MKKIGILCKTDKNYYGWWGYGVGLPSLAAYGTADIYLRRFDGLMLPFGNEVYIPEGVYHTEKWNNECFSQIGKKLFDELESNKLERDRLAINKSGSLLNDGFGVKEWSFLVRNIFPQVKLLNFFDNWNDVESLAQVDSETEKMVKYHLKYNTYYKPYNVYWYTNLDIIFQWYKDVTGAKSDTYTKQETFSESFSNDLFDQQIVEIVVVENEKIASKLSREVDKVYNLEQISTHLQQLQQFKKKSKIDTVKVHNQRNRMQQQINKQMIRSSRKVR